MILKNFLAMNSNNTLGSSISSGLYSSSQGKIYTTSTSNMYAISKFASADETTNTFNYGDLYVLIGAGETTPVEDDVGLESIIIAADSTNTSATLKLINSTSFAPTIAADGRSYTRKVSSTYRNDNPQQSYVVREVGIGTPNLMNSNSNYKSMTTNETVNVTDRPHGCVTRDVLTTPVTINYGDTYTFTVEIAGLPCYITPPTT